MFFLKLLRIAGVALCLGACLSLKASDSHRAHYETLDLTEFFSLTHTPPLEDPLSSFAPPAIDNLEGELGEELQCSHLSLHPDGVSSLLGSVVAGCARLDASTEAVASSLVLREAEQRELDEQRRRKSPERERKRKRIRIRPTKSAQRLAQNDERRLENEINVLLRAITTKLETKSQPWKLLSIQVCQSHEPGMKYPDLIPRGEVLCRFLDQLPKRPQGIRNLIIKKKRIEILTEYRNQLADYLAERLEEQAPGSTAAAAAAAVAASY